MRTENWCGYDIRFILIDVSDHPSKGVRSRKEKIYETINLIFNSKAA